MAKIKIAKKTQRKGAAADSDAKTAFPEHAKISKLLQRAVALVNSDTPQARSSAEKAREMVTSALWRHNLDITTFDEIRLSEASPAARELLELCAGILLVVARCDVIQDERRRGRDLAASTARLYAMLHDRLGEAAALRIQADAMRFLREFDAAEERFRRSIELCRAIGDAAGVGCALAGLAFVRTAQNRYDEAQQLLDESAAAGGTAPDPEARILHSLCHATLGHMLGAYEKGLRAAEDAIACSRATDNIVGLTGALNRAGISLSYLGRVDDALSYIEEALAGARRLGSRTAEALSLQCKGLALIDINRYTEALAAFTSLADIYVDLNQPGEEARTYNNMTLALYNLGQYGRSLHFARRSLELHELLHIRRGAGIAHTNIARAMGRLARYDQALEHHAGALKIYRKLGARGVEALTLCNIAKLYRQMKNYGKFEEYAGLTLAIAREVDDRSLESWSELSLGLCYAERLDDTNAEKHYSYGLSIARAIDDLRCQADCIRAQGQLRYRSGAYREALELFRQNLALRDQMNDAAQQADAKMGIAKAQRKLGELKPALETLEQALADAEAAEFPQILPEIHKELSAVHEAMGDHKRSLWHFKTFNTAQREQFTVESRERLHNLQVAEELEQARHDAELQETRRATAERELDLQQRELMSLTMATTRNSESLRTAYRQMEELKPQTPANIRAALTEMMATLEQSLNSGQDWEVFEQRFTKIHSTFLPTLRQRFPDLSPMETKVCSLVKLNLNIKEMAHLLNVGTDTIKKHRYHIRRKLGLQQSDNLVTFLAGL